MLLQIFTKPLGDRPTIFIEIIERRGCLKESKPAGGEGNAAAATEAAGKEEGEGQHKVAADGQQEEQYKDVVQVGAWLPVLSILDFCFCATGLALQYH